ncbi:MAG: YdcF family protein [Cytophagales bacterium]|nr:YdcF family protein [Cytophagales bacterium]
MFFVLSKTLFYLLMPMTWIAGLLAYAWFAKSPTRKKRASKIAFILLLFFSNNLIVNEAIRWWEIPTVPIAELPKHDIAVVLTGVTDTQREPKDRVYFSKGADRILHPLQLYKAGKVDKILISGGSGRLVSRQKDESEAEELASVLKLAGVPDSAVVLENQSRNTRENATFSAKILKNRFPGKRYLLVTSAFHMRRAAGCFRKAGVPVTVFSTDFYGSPRKWTPDYWLLPSEGAIGKWSTLWHEWIGYVSYAVTGYL